MVACYARAQIQDWRAVVSCTLGEAYVVIKRLPKQDGEFEYQIKSVNELDERTVRESQLRTNPFAKLPWMTP